MSELKSPVMWGGIRTTARPNGHLESTSNQLRSVGGNSGNMAFVHAIFLTIDNLKSRIMQTPDYPDSFILACANQITARDTASPESPYFESSMPLVAIGLGAQAESTETEFTLGPKTTNWIEKIQGNSNREHPNISLRGNYTYSILKKAGLHEKTIALGCPSLFISPEKSLGDNLKSALNKNPVNISVVCGNLPRLADATIGIERSLAKIASFNQGEYIVQHPAEIIALARDPIQSADKALSKHVKDLILPELTQDQFEDWFKRHVRYFFDLNNWFEHLREKDFVIGTRIHGTMLALQRGIPAVCITIDSRTEELCEIMRIPSISHKEIGGCINLEQVIEVFLSHDWGSFDSNRIELALRYADFLVKNGVAPSKHLNDLIS